MDLQTISLFMRQLIIVRRTSKAPASQRIKKLILLGLMPMNATAANGLAPVRLYCGLAASAPVPAVFGPAPANVSGDGDK